MTEPSLSSPQESGRSSSPTLQTVKPTSLSAPSSVMPSLASADGPGGASFAACFEPPPEDQHSTVGKTSSPAASVSDSASPSTPNASTPAAAKGGSGGAALVTPPAATPAGDPSPVVASPPKLKSSALTPSMPSAAAAIKRAMTESNAKATPSKASKKTKCNHALADLDLESVEGIERSYRELFGALSSPPNAPADQLNEILHRFIVDHVKEWALSATGQAWPKKKKKEAYDHVSKLVVSRLESAETIQATPRPCVPRASELPRVAASASSGGVAAPALSVGAPASDTSGAGSGVAVVGSNVKDKDSNVVADPAMLKEVGLFLSSTMTSDMATIKNFAMSVIGMNANGGYMLAIKNDGEMIYLDPAVDDRCFAKATEISKAGGDFYKWKFFESHAEMTAFVEAGKRNHSVGADTKLQSFTGAGSPVANEGKLDSTSGSADHLGFETFQVMGNDMSMIAKFKYAALKHLFATDANTTPAPLFMVCAKYGGEICFFAANDVVTMKDLLPQLNGKGSDYYVWSVFENNAEARTYYDKVRAVDVSPYIPRDPKQVKAERDAALGYLSNDRNVLVEFVGDHFNAVTDAKSAKAAFLVVLMNDYSVLFRDASDETRGDEYVQLCDKANDMYGWALMRSEVEAVSLQEKLIAIDKHLALPEIESVRSAAALAKSRASLPVVSLDAGAPAERKPPVVNPYAKSATTSKSVASLTGAASKSSPVASFGVEFVDTNDPSSPPRTPGKSERRQRLNLQIKANCKARAQSWEPVINEETRLVKIILRLINAEVTLLTRTQNLDLCETDLFSSNYVQRAKRQAHHVYHSLYRGDRDFVIVRQSGDASLSGRVGLVSQYIEPSKNRPFGMYVTRLRTKSVSLPTVYEGEERSISPEYLEVQLPPGHKKRNLPSFHSVAIAYDDTNGSTHSLAFVISRGTVDALVETMSSSDRWSDEQLEEFLRSQKRDVVVGDLGNHPQQKLHQDRTIDRSSYFKNDGIFKYSVKQSRYGVCMKKAPVIDQCPCHQSTTCEFKAMCGLCTDASVADPFSGAPQPPPNPSDDFDMDLVLRPDDRVLECPFVTKSSIVPNAALYLNELNIMAAIRKIVPEETIMTRLSKFVDSITNRDVLSLYPHYNISVSIFNLLIGWLGAQVDNDLVTIMPAEFFGQVMSANDIRPLALEALRKYPDILSSRLIIFPLVCKSQFTLFAVSNPIALVKPELISRGVPFMMNLHPGDEATRPRVKDTSRRLRLLLNRLAEFDTKLCVTNKPFSAANMKMIVPRVSEQHCAEDNGFTIFKLTHALMRMSRVAFTKEDLKTNLASAISANRIFKFCALDVWRCRTEAYVLIMNLARMYSTERVQDISNSIQRKHNEVDDFCPVVTVPGLLNCSYLSANIDKGDVIEYKFQRPNINGTVEDSVRRATVIAIRLEADQITKTVVLNNRDRLSDGSQLVRRVSMRNLYTNEPMWNPVREWRELRSIHLYPTMDAADGSFPSGDVGTHDGVDFDGDVVMSDPSKNQAEYDRRRTNGNTSVKQRTRRATRMRSLHTGDLGNFFHWMAPHLIAEEVVLLNKLYRTCAEIGKLSHFYNLLKCTSKTAYTTKKNNLRRDVWERRERKGVVALNMRLPFRYFWKYQDRQGVTRGVSDTDDDSPFSSAEFDEIESTRPPITKRDVNVMEETIKFEHGNQSIKVQHCRSCRENLLNKVNPLLHKPDEPFKCDSCKDIPDDFFEAMGLQPIWYERNPGATRWDDFKEGPNGKRIARYDIPEELAGLTMSEQLLIRKSAPYVPSVHLSNGFFALSGQCVAFTQDLSDLCIDLPRQPKEIVTFIRQMGNSETSNIHLRHLRVRRSHVLRALRWLKIHHSEYRDIVINECNLDWMGDKSEASLSSNVRNLTVPGRKSDKNQKAAVSQVQCLSDIKEDDLTFSTMSEGTSSLGVHPEQAEMMGDLYQAAEESNQRHKLLLFPPHGDEPISEYDPNLKVYSTAYPWLFPGGIGDVYDEVRGRVDDLEDGPIRNLKSWAKHLLRFEDGRFQKCQLFGLYVFNMIQRQENNKKGAYFHSDKGWYGKNPPTLEELKNQIRHGIFTFVSKLRYYAQTIRGSDGYWRNKTNELRSWIDFHVSRGHGPPTHFITLTCAENWWSDLRDIYADLETNAGNIAEASLLRAGNFRAMSRAARKYPMYVNEYFMMRAKRFMDEFARDALDLEYYWGRVEFASGRGAIHLHILGIGKNKAYLNDFYRAKSESAKTKVLQRYAEETLGMTANVAFDPNHKKFDSDNSGDNTVIANSPLGVRYTEVSDPALDRIHLAQDAMCHCCNEYCLGYVDKAGIKLRQCRFGYGQEATSNKGDTPGKDFLPNATIVKERGIEHLHLPRLHSRTVVQHSQHVLQAWRANADVQLLIYRSNPDIPDVGEIEAVSKYCTAYAGKTHHTTREEISTIQDVILGSYDSDLSHISTVTKKSLNKLSGSRQVSIQEAMHEIAGLDLVICSDYLTDVSLGKALYLRKDSDSKVDKKDLISSYRNRKVELENLSLEQYFYEHFVRKKCYEDSSTGRLKNRILIPKGLNCRPRFPVDYDYAKGMLVMHRPWSCRQPLTDLLNDEQGTIDTFLRMMQKREVPQYVEAEYHRAVRYSQQWQYECIAKRVAVNDEINLDDLDPEEMENIVHWEHSRHLSDKKGARLDDHVLDMRVDLGIDHDWTKSFFQGQRSPDRLPPELYVNYLKDIFYGESTSSEPERLLIPKRPDGDEYLLSHLNHQQQTVVICALEAVIKFLNNDKSYKPLRATVMGCGGTGKSYIINTLIAMVRRYTRRNDTVRVAAPSGGAAYNVGGTTLHRCLKLSVDSETLARDLNADKRAELARQIENMLMLIIDERSMISSGLLAAAERNVRHCAYGEKNQNELWGGVPVVLVFGDDYQLPPVIEEGAINGFAKLSDLWEQKESKKSPAEQLLVRIGNSLFQDDLTSDVFHLTENYRTRADPEWAKILERLRVGLSTDADAERLMKQGLHHHRTLNPGFINMIENHPKTVYLFTKNHEKNVKNLEKLATLSQKTNVPVARLQCQWHSNKNQGQGSSRVYKNHFKTKQMVLESDLCVGATVALSGLNIVPEAGLFNGARGKVIDFVYNTVCGPNDRHGDPLPICVIVDFPGLRLGNAKPWDSNHPTHVPIPMTDIDCSKQCCSARFCPLVLAWATTVHKFQGFEAGFDEKDTVNYIIADINSLDWEKMNPGTAYVVASRAKTIGHVADGVEFPTASNLFFIGTMYKRRFTRCLYKKNNEKCVAVQKREHWVNYLLQKVELTKEKRSPEAMDTARNFVTDAMNRPVIQTTKDLQERIVDIIHTPNDTWKDYRKHYTL